MDWLRALLTYGDFQEGAVTAHPIDRLARGFWRSWGDCTYLRAAFSASIFRQAGQDSFGRRKFPAPSPGFGQPTAAVWAVGHVVAV